MGTITSGIGLVSGINSKDIIDQLMSIESQPKTLLQARQATVNAQKSAFSDVQTTLSSLQSFALAVERPSTFTASTAESSDEHVLTATAGASAAVGSFQFQVAQLVTAQQSVTGGFSKPDALVGAGTMTLEMGGGNVDARTTLAQLNGGAGVRRGQFKITDATGKTGLIDISSAITVDDVLKKINTSLDVSVKATVKGDKLVLTDTSGGSVGQLNVQDLGGGFAAADLGLVGTATAGTLQGSDVNSLGTSTALSALNDGRGVRFNADNTSDFQITLKDGSNVSVKLSGVLTVGDVLTKINTAAGTKLTASVATGGNGITLTDNTGGGGTLAVAAQNGSKAAGDLGLLTTASGNTLTGSPVLAGIDTVLLSSLNGGVGLSLGTINITDRTGALRPVDLSGAKTVQDVLDTITGQAGIQVTASLNASHNGIQLSDRSGGTGNLVIADGDAKNSATALGLAGTFDATKPVVSGANLQLQWVSENTTLSSYNGGKGVTPGSFKITNSGGGTVTIDLSDGTATKLGDVITAINNSAHNIGVTASINAHGDGLLLTDASGGAGKMKVENGNGTTGTDLNIVGIAGATPTIDGSFEKTIDVTATDTLTTVQTKIQTLGFGVSANIINDGSGQSPYRLSLTSVNSGLAGRVVIDGGTTTVQTQDLVQSQDAAVFVGGAGSAQPLLITSSKNQLANIVPGVSIDLHGVSTGPVQLNVTRNPDDVVGQIGKFVDGFNGMVDKITDLTKYDTDKQQGGLLLGDSTIDQVQTELYLAFNGVVQGAGRYRILSDVGITVTDGAKLQFDEAKFRTAFATDPDAVKNLFSQSSTKLNSTVLLNTLNGGHGVRTAAGQPDFKITTKSGTSFNVNIGAASTLDDIVSAINTASAGKVTATYTDAGTGLKLTDNSTTGTTAFTVSSLNGSLAATDLGIAGTGVGGVLTGQPIYKSNTAGGGFGYQIDRSLSKLIDPVDGAITRETQDLTDRAQQFQDRMDQLDSLLTDKRARLEKQFANMESVLAGLQGQQSALSSFTGVSNAPAAKAA